MASARLNELRAEYADRIEAEMRLLVVHASQQAAPPERRRLLQVLTQGRERTTADGLARAAELFGRAGSTGFAPIDHLLAPERRP